MDPVAALAAGVLLGAVLGPIGSAPGWCWAALAVGTERCARLHPLGALPAAVFVGLACAAVVPVGPAWDGPVGIVGVRVSAASGRTGDVEVTARLDAGEWVPARGRVRVRFRDDAPGPGARVMVRGDAHPVRHALPGAPDPVRAARLAGIVTQVDAWTDAALGGARPAPIPPDLDPTGLMRAILLGDRAGVSSETEDVLRRTGTTHLLSVSGFHVGAAAWMVTLAFGPLVRAIGAARPVGAPDAALTAISIAAVWAYTALAQWPIPAERAAALLTVALLARATGRRVAPARWLWIVAAALAILEPGSPATASYQLSFGAMFGLVWFSPWITRWLPLGLPRPLRWAADGLAATFGATLGTLPFAAWWFQALPPLSPLANLIALPTLGLAVVPIAAVVATAPSPLRELAAAAGTALCRASLAALAPLAVEPWTPALSAAGALGLGAALVIASYRAWLGAPLAVAVFLVPHPIPDHLRVTVLPVGQGAAALVEWPDGRRWLVDGGPGRDDVLAWLRRVGIRRLDVVVQTHPDRDHSRGLGAILEALPVGEVWASELDPDLAAIASRRAVPVRDPPIPPLPGGSDNDRSVALIAGPVLVAGDLERAGERHLAAQLDGALPVLLVAHHGSRTSSTPAFLDAVRPAVAVISVGAGNPYGHPAPEVVERLQRRGIAVFRTDEDGAIVIDADDSSVTVRSAW